jgi:hypothetical protein
MTQSNRFQAAAGILGQDSSQSQSLLSIVSPGHGNLLEQGVVVPNIEVDILPVCCVKTCKHKDSTLHLRPCCGHRYTCKKFIHSYCYGALFIRKHNLESLVHPTEGATYVACTKRCHTKALTGLKNGTFPADTSTVRIAWEKDGVDGPTDINNSMNILLEWLTENGGDNY